MAEKLTIDKLIQGKEKYEVKRDVKKEVLIKRDNGTEFTITIKKPSRSLCVECLSMTNDQNQQELADTYMAYNIVIEPNLKNTNLHKAYKCVEPTDIVNKIFETGEIAQIAGQGMLLAGYNSELKVIDDLKN